MGCSPSSGRKRNKLPTLEWFQGDDKTLGVKYRRKLADSDDYEDLTTYMPVTVNFTAKENEYDSEEDAAIPTKTTTAEIAEGDPTTIIALFSIVGTDTEDLEGDYIYDTEYLFQNGTKRLTTGRGILRITQDITD